jgi:hypothetical protein
MCWWADIRTQPVHILTRLVFVTSVKVYMLCYLKHLQDLGNSLFFNPNSCLAQQSVVKDGNKTSSSSIIFCHATTVSGIRVLSHRNTTASDTRKNCRNIFENSLQDHDDWFFLDKRPQPHLYWKRNHDDWFRGRLFTRWSCHHVH